MKRNHTFFLMTVCLALVLLLHNFNIYDRMDWTTLYNHFTNRTKQLNDKGLQSFVELFGNDAVMVKRGMKIQKTISASSKLVTRKQMAIQKDGSKEDHVIANRTSKNSNQNAALKTANKKLAAPRPVIEDIKPPPWHKPVDLRIISLVFNRASSLKRQLDSLNTAEYFGDNVLVDIWIDRSKKDGKIDPKTYLVAKNFTFKYGDVRVHSHTRHVGLYGQWFGTWNPDPKSKEIAVFLEDDVSVSPLFYRWLKNVHKKYHRRTDVAGYSLRGTCPRYRGPYVDIRAPETEFCMLYRATGSWGISPQRDNWFQFIEWYKNASRDLTFQPLVTGITPTKWYLSFLKKGTSDDMWTMWHIYYTHVNNQYTLFLNFPNKAGLTSHWQEGGLHFSKHQTLKKSAPLLTKWDPKYDHLPDKLVKLDYDGTIIK